MKQTLTHLYVKKIVISALLVALGVVFARILSLPLSITLSGVSSMTIGLGMLPILLLCVLYGPIWGSIGALAWDVIGALIFPMGAYHPLFSISAAIFGFVVGMFFVKNKDASIVHIFFATLSGQLVYSVLLNTLLLVLLYGLPFRPLIIARGIENILMLVINTLLISIIIDTIKNYKLMPERFPVCCVQKLEENSDGHTDGMGK